MTYNKTLLENYLNRMERTMKSISVSERAEIITEIKSHVLESLEQNPESTVESVLKALGEPETVANRYLLERGLKPQRPPRHPVLKWLVIGFLGTFGIFAIMTTVLVLKFSPIVEVNEKEGKVRILGGLIKVDGDINFEDDMKVGTDVEKFVGFSLDGEDEEGGKFSIKINEAKGGDGFFAGNTKGRHPMEPGKRLKVNFLNGKMKIKTSNSNELIWNCKSVGATEGGKAGDVVSDATGYTLDFGKRMAVKCSIAVPKQAILNIDGTNGKLDIDKPGFAIETKLINGRVNLEPDKTLAYQYNVKVQNGSADSFTSSSAQSALPVNISLVNGSIHATKDNEHEEEVE